MTLSTALHDGVSRWIWRPLHLTSRLARGHTRPAVAAYAEGMRFRARSAGWNEEQRTAWVLRRLRETVRHAASTSSFYRDRLRSAGFDPSADFSFEDYGRLPVLEREEIREAGPAIRSSGVPEALVRRDATGGSTGTPTVLWTGPEHRGWSESASEHYLRRIGLPAGTRLAYLWGHHLDPVARTTVRERVDDWLNNVSWYDCLRLSDETLLAYHEELQRRRPAGIIAYASALAALADVVERHGLRPRYPTRAFVTGAEKLFSHQREAVERVFSAPVHERYGARDAGLIGTQLDPRTTLDFTVDWANVLVEPEFAPAGGDATAVLITKLHSDAMPMLRYRIGDMARFPAGACPGHPSWVLHEIVGRDVQRLWLPDGRWMHGVGFPHLMKDFPIRDFQVTQEGDFSVEVRVVPSDAFGPAHEAEIIGAVRANLPGVPVTLRSVTEIPRTRANKWQPVVSRARPTQTREEIA